MNKLLIDDYPIQVLPKLAELIGLNEAIVLQQIHYWLNNSKHKYDGKTWIFNSYPEWQKQFPFWSLITIKRTIYSLEKQNLLLIGNYNKAKFDKTKWYSINYQTIEGMIRPSYQNDTTSVSKRDDGVYQNDTTNTIDYTETNKHRETDDVSKSFKYISINLEIIQNPLKAEQLEHEIKSFKQDQFEIVKVATDYCKENNKSLNYLLTVLKNWNKEGVSDKESAENKLKPRKTKKETTDDVIAQMEKELSDD
ncbi:DnaD domain protein [Staphylococcus aureus]|uniref:DnaD domain protein n=6 Tax=Staphylococcus aureus TaxID=1280 RepID=UPI0004E268DA|nr:DnaD domain protein [Staphylococcus aureus]UHS65772.1 replication initiation protein [Staphylococcus phage 2PHSA1]UMO77452.1 replication initiation protein [Staphylococcus phage 4PHCISA25]UVD41684.1 replication initiation protein [Staphylococcus phage A12-4PHSA25]UWJ04701.1 replication initiation protein [Staphylococcus phage PHB38a]WGL32276.1 replication initiation protein [Staphylococcus phage phiST9-B]